MKIKPLTLLKLVAFKFKQNLKNLFIKLGILIALFIIFSFAINVFSYFDPVDFCYIGIDQDSLRGNQETIKKAISLIKKNDKTTYKILCKYVNTIKETGWLPRDLYLNSSENDPNNPPAIETVTGYYVKGSKVIYLKSVNTYSADIIRERANNIKKYANYSKNFWDSRK